MTVQAKNYLTLIMAGGLFAAFAALRAAPIQPELDRRHLPLLFGLALFAMLLVVLRLVRPTREAPSGVGTLVLFGALLLPAPQTVMLVLTIVAIDLACRPKQERPPWFVLAFNAAQLMLASVLAHAANVYLHGDLASRTPSQAVSAALPAALVFAAVNYGLLWGVHRFVDRFEGGFCRLLETEAVEEASILMIVALARAAWTVQPWFILLAAGPLIFFWRLYRTVGRLEYANSELRKTQQQAIDGLVQTLATKDNEVSGHSERVALSTGILAEALGMEPGSEEFEILVRGALLHDVGKIGIRDAVLHKPGKLTDEEWAEMRDHSSIGFELVQSFPFLRDPAAIVLAHHERWDGKGYPRSLRGEQIPFGARIFAVADTFDAITAARPYRPARSANEAVSEIVRCSGTQFDPIVVACFLKVFEQLPIGLKTEYTARAAIRSA